MRPTGCSQLLSSLKWSVGSPPRPAQGTWQPGPSPSAPHSVSPGSQPSLESSPEATGQSSSSSLGLGLSQVRTVGSIGAPWEGAVRVRETLPKCRQTRGRSCGGNQRAAPRSEECL